MAKPLQLKTPRPQLRWPAKKKLRASVNKLREQPVGSLSGKYWFVMSRVTQNLSDLRKPRKAPMGHTASSLAEGIAEQTNDYFFRSCCGALLQVVSPRPATPTFVLRAHLFAFPRPRAGLGH